MGIKHSRAKKSLCDTSPLKRHGYNSVGIQNINGNVIFHIRKGDSDYSCEECYINHVIKGDSDNLCEECYNNHIRKGDSDYSCEECYINHSIKGDSDNVCEECYKISRRTQFEQRSKYARKNSSYPRKRYDVNPSDESRRKSFRYTYGDCTDSSDGEVISSYDVRKRSNDLRKKRKESQTSENSHKLKRERNGARIYSHSRTKPRSYSDSSDENTFRENRQRGFKARKNEIRSEKTKHLNLIDQSHADNVNKELKHCGEKDEIVTKQRQNSVISKTNNEPIQVDGSIQQEDSPISKQLIVSGHNTESILDETSGRKQHDNSSTNTADLSVNCAASTDSLDIDAGFQNAGTSVRIPCDTTTELRDSGPISCELNTSCNGSRFENQSDVVSIATNSVDSEREVDKIPDGPDQWGFSHRPCPVEDLQTLQKNNFFIENRIECSNCATARKCSIVSEYYSDSETILKQRQSVIKDKEDKRCNRFFNDSLFDDTQREDAFDKLELQRESETENLDNFKLPGPSLQEERTELKRFVTPPILIDLEQLPSSGYPFNTSNSLIVLSQDFPTGGSKEGSNECQFTSYKEELTKNTLNSEHTAEEIEMLPVSQLELAGSTASQNETDIKQNCQELDNIQIYEPSVENEHQTQMDRDSCDILLKRTGEENEFKTNSKSVKTGELEHKLYVKDKLSEETCLIESKTVERSHKMGSQNFTFKRKRQLSDPGDRESLHHSPKYHSVPSTMTKEFEFGNDDSGYESLNCAANSEQNNAKIKLKTISSKDVNVSYNEPCVLSELSEIKLSEAVPDAKCFKDRNCASKSKSSKVSRLMSCERICLNISASNNLKLVNSYICPTVLSVIIDVNGTRIIKVSDEGLLQEISLSLEDDNCFPEKMVDEKYKDAQRGKVLGKTVDNDEGYRLKDENTISRHEYTDPSDKAKKDSSDRHSQDENLFGNKKHFILKSHERKFIDCFIDVQEYHGYTEFSQKTEILHNEKLPFLSKAASERDLVNRNYTKDILPPENAKLQKHSRTLKRDSKVADSVMMKTSKTYHLHNSRIDDNDTQVLGKFSRGVSQIQDDTGKRRKKLKKKKKITLHSETSSFSPWEPQSQNYLESISSSFKKRSMAKKKRECKKKEKQKTDDDVSSSKNRSVFTGLYRDSGIGDSCYSENIYASYSIVSRYRNTNCSTAKVLRKIVPSVMKKISVERKLQKSLKHFFKRCFGRNKRKVPKSLFKDFFEIPKTKQEVRVLESYFQKMSNGPPPSTQESMRYEWLRLASFSNYNGNGSAIVLARNGFYHDHSEGPSSTRCFMCDARNSDWERFDNVEAEHRRQSPNCPFHASHGQESVNIPISYENNDDAALEPRETMTVTSTSTTITEVSTTSTAAVNEATRALQSTQISDASMSGGESISQQPTEDPESRDRSLLAFSQPRQLRALGRTGNSYSTIIAPRRNNVAIGARSNVGIDPSRNGSSTSGTASQSPGRPSSVLGGPVGAGAFAGPSNGQQVPVSTTTESSQQSNVPSPAVEAAAGAGSGAGGRTDPTITVVVDNPKHPDYLNIETRVNSYHGWPDYLDQTASQMSEAGFFYVGVADFTRCFCCGGGLRNWEPGDDPMLEHTRWFPRCEYVNKLKGERYVAAVQRRHTEHMAEQQRQQLELAQRRDENRNPPDPMTTDAAAVMREMGYSIERTREAILAVRQQTGTVDVTTQQVLTWLLDYEERRLNSETSNTELGVRPPPSPSPTETSTVETSTPSTVVNTGTISENSTVNTTSRTSTSATVVSASTTTSTVNTTSTMATAEVQQSGTSASSTGRSETGTGNQQTGSTAGASNSSSSTSQSGTGEDKQPGASGGDSDEPKSTTEGTASSETSTKSSKKKNTKKKSKNKASTKPGTSGATGSDIDAKSLKAENEKLREMQTCKICMERAVNTTLLPCGHLVCCDTCAARLQRCPICRKRIKGTVKTFMS